MDQIFFHFSIHTNSFKSLENLHSKLSYYSNFTGEEFKECTDLIINLSCSVVKYGARSTQGNLAPEKFSIECCYLGDFTNIKLLP